MSACRFSRIFRSLLYKLFSFCSFVGSFHPTIHPPLCTIRTSVCMYVCVYENSPRNTVGIPLPWRQDVIRLAALPAIAVSRLMRVRRRVRGVVRVGQRRTSLGSVAMITSGGLLSNAFNTISAVLLHSLQILTFF